jgi:hypothetical protein
MKFLQGMYRYVLVHTFTYLYVLVCTIIDTVLLVVVQDTVLAVPPYPCSIEEDCHDVPLEDCWTVCHQLFCSCFLRPKGRRPAVTKQERVNRPRLSQVLPGFLQHL